jgi:transposase
MQETRLCIGVDVSKAELIISFNDALRARNVANDAASITAWLREVPQGSFMAMESTGRYHGLLAQLAYQAGMRVYVLNARDVHFYAKALGTRAKTDSVDARLIARYLVQHHEQLHAWQPANRLQQRLHDLLTRRAQLAAQRSAVRQVVSGVDASDIDVSGLYQAFDSLLKAMDARVQELIASDEQLAAGCRRLCTITGIGPQTSALLATLLSRLTFVNADALVAYCGLDPRPNDSGTRHGRRRLSKRGPALLRRQVYLAGFSASRSHALKPLYLALRAKGFASTPAFIILGRKLLRAAFAVWRGTQSFDPTRLFPQNSLQKP